jgi:anaerobic magnesium-protoporphyrin IX monomethyl ester cyclase
MRVALIGAELEENLALRCLAGALQAEGHDPLIVPFDEPQDERRAAADLAGSGAAIAGFSMVFTRRGEEFARLIRRCRELGFRGLTLAGGSFAAFHAEQLLRDVAGLDAVAVGEGERILCELARDPASPGSVPGLVWRDGETVRRNPPATVEEDLDRLPWPLHRRPFDRYLGLSIVNLLGSRGCTYGCGFCSIAAWHRLCGGSRYRQRSVESIAAEIGCLYREGVRIFNFHDDNFLGTDRAQNTARVHSLRRALADQGVERIGFQIKARPDAVDPELFALLRSMGLFRVFLGIEAGSTASLRSLGRGQRLEDNVRALEVLNALDLHVAWNLLCINPDSTLDDFAENVAFLRAHAENALNFCRTEIYAETPLEQRLRGEGRLLGDYWGLDYRIDDERVQRAYEIFTAAFFERNFGKSPLHYLSAQVDYEHQLRADFFGTTASLRAEAKAFVRRVNENTASHLEEIIAAVRAEEASQAFAQAVAARVAADDVRLHAEGQAILRRVRQLPARPSRRSSATVAAAIALAVTGCSGRQETHMMEAVPRPPTDVRPPPPDLGPRPEPVPSHMREAAPPPPQVREAAPPPPRDPPERLRILNALQRAGGDPARAAAMLKLGMPEMCQQIVAHRLWYHCCHRPNLPKGATCPSGTCLARNCRF